MNLVQSVLGSGENVGHHSHPLLGVGELGDVTVQVNRTRLLLLQCLQ